MHLDFTRRTFKCWQSWLPRNDLRTQHWIHTNQPYCVITTPDFDDGHDVEYLKHHFSNFFLIRATAHNIFTSLGGEVVGGEVIGGEISRWQENRESPTNSSHKAVDKQNIDLPPLIPR